ALVLGGTGVIGRATAARLLACGWSVRLVGRNPAHLPTNLASAGATFVVADARRPDQLAEIARQGGDMLVDCLCYTARDAERLLPFLARFASSVMISTKAVYADGAGNHVNSSGAPRFPVPIDEAQPTLTPGDGNYTTPAGYGANKVAAEQVLLESGAPVTVIRASKVHGPGGSRPREWVFVKRALDQRPAVFLAGRGAGVDHMTAAANLAALIDLVAANPGRRVLNCADPDAPSAVEISRIIAHILGHEREEILLDEDCDPNLGRHPWEAPRPIVLDTSAATRLGYIPVGDYAFTVEESVRWLAAQARFEDGAAALPGLDEEFFAPMLDYGAEDRYLAARRPA
ncbi:MAG: NAD-dependent epimerase/dehydratase family protein, partial [Acidimicrobiia bacterium]